MDAGTRSLLEDVRRSVTDAEGKLSDAVYALENDSDRDVETLVSEALSRLKTLDRQLARHLERRA